MEASNGPATSEDISAGLEELKIREEDGDGPDLWNPPPRKECPICMLPLPWVPSDRMYMNCCGKMICMGCAWNNARVIDETNIKNSRKNRDRGIAPLEESCAFCRVPPTADYKEHVRRFEKRMQLNDPIAFYNVAGMHKEGVRLWPKNINKAFELTLRASELGHAEACHAVAEYYRLGEVVEKDYEKATFYLEKAAKNGYTLARHRLAGLETKRGNVDIAVKHYLLSAGAGCQLSLDSIKQMCTRSVVSKDQYAEALRSFQAAMDEEKSEERERWAAEKARRERLGLGSYLC